jgi:hypothetical protein
MTNFRAAPDLIPCSDMAGEIVLVGDDVSGGWKVGDRVCANFCADHIDGDITTEIQKTAHGGASHGVLTEYKTFRPHVSFNRNVIIEWGNTDHTIPSLWSRYQSIFLMKKLLLFRRDPHLVSRLIRR